MGFQNHIVGVVGVAGNFPTYTHCLVLVGIVVYVEFNKFFVNQRVCRRNKVYPVGGSNREVYLQRTFFITVLHLRAIRIGRNTCRYTANLQRPKRTIEIKQRLRIVLLRSRKVAKPIRHQQGRQSFVVRNTLLITCGKLVVLFHGSFQGCSRRVVRKAVDGVDNRNNRFGKHHCVFRGLYVEVIQIEGRTTLQAREGNAVIGDNLTRLLYKRAVDVKRKVVCTDFRRRYGSAHYGIPCVRRDDNVESVIIVVVHIKTKFRYVGDVVFQLSRRQFQVGLVCKRAADIAFVGSFAFYNIRFIFVQLQRTVKRCRIQVDYRYVLITVEAVQNDGIALLRFFLHGGRAFAPHSRTSNTHRHARQAKH